MITAVSGACSAWMIDVELIPLAMPVNETGAELLLEPMLSDMVSIPFRGGGRGLTAPTHPALRTRR